MGLFVVFAIGSLASYAGTQDSANKADNTPYGSIVARNVFGLLPIPPPAAVTDMPPADPPPKITPNGIMTIFGRDEALFKVAEKPKPGQPAKEVSHVLGEGEMEDEITVVKIDRAAGMITFSNHGAVQELPLVVAKESAASPPPGVPPPRNPLLPGAVPPPGAPGYQRQLPRPMGGGPGFTPQSSAVGNPGGGPGAQTAQQSENIEERVMSAAREMATIEQNRIATQDLVDQGKLPPIPPTLMTPPEAHVGNSPLIQSPQAPVNSTGQRQN